MNGILSQFADGFHVFRSPLDMTRAIAFSFLTWGLGILMLVFMLEAFRIDYPWYTPFVMQAMLAVFISAPNTPGFVGQFHVPIVLALVMTVSTIDPNEAKAFAIVTHLIQLPPVILLGVWRLMHERMGLLQLQSEGKKLAHEEHEDHEDC